MRLAEAGIVGHHSGGVEIFEDNYGGAAFGPKGLEDPHRYFLWRYLTPGSILNRDANVCAFGLLNPSTADHRLNDPTVTRCIGYAKRWGYDVLWLFNIFSLRSTDPKKLYELDGPDILVPHSAEGGAINDEVITRVAMSTDLLVCGWGTHGALRERGEKVKDLFALRCQHDVQPHVLGLTKEGHPKHPLYLKNDLQPAPWPRWQYSKETQ